VDHFKAECLAQFGPERVAQFAAELVAGWLRNPHSILSQPVLILTAIILASKCQFTFKVHRM